MRTLPFSKNLLCSRADVQRLVRDLAEPLIPHFSEGRAQVRLGANRAHYGDPTGWLEGFARPLWGLVPLEAGGGGFDHWNLWMEGLVAGVDPSHPEYWGCSGDYDQRSVEQAVFGFALALAPGRFWRGLSTETRARLAAWLGRINEVQLVRNNWLFFRILVNLGLRSCGGEWSLRRIEEDFALIETLHLGGGWYSDGAPGAPWRDGRTGDYYVPMAFQLYGLVYAQLAGADDPSRAALFRARAGEFALDFQHWFAEDGAALPFGRSLVYRFAQGAFWGALAFAGVEALPWGVIKGLYLRHLRWWMRQPIFSDTGLLTIGYAYPDLLMAESYNSSGSPYWALKAFLPLALPDEHPFWQAEELPLPPRRAVHTVTGAGLILTTDPLTRDVTAINPGQPVLDWPRNAPHKYSKCAYSTRFGFSVPTSAATPKEGGFDGTLSLSEDGRFFLHRDFCLGAVVCDGVAYSRWQPWPDVEVRTWILAEPRGHLRVHRLSTGRPLHAMEAGFAACWTDRGSLRVDERKVRTPVGVSVLRDLGGGREVGSLELGANSHLLASLSSMPVLRSVHEPGVHWLACGVMGGAPEEKDFTFLDRFSFGLTKEGCRVSRDGEPWWTLAGEGCGESSAARLRSLRRLS